MRTGFGRGFPQHDPWLFDSRRLTASGETDCVLCGSGPLVRLLNRATNGGPNARFPFGSGSLDLCYGVIRIRF